MKKRIVSLVMAICLTLSLMVAMSACGGKPTLEEYYNSDEMQALISTAVEQYSAQGIDCGMSASGDELHYDFALTTPISEDERSYYEEALATELENNGQSFVDAADEVKAAVSNETVTVVVTYYDADGGVLATKSYTSGS